MRSALVLSALLIAAAGCAPSGSQADRPDIEYVREPARFKRDGGAPLDFGEAGALSVAKDALRKKLGSPVRGEFSVARSRTGYQVNFTRLQKKAPDGLWAEVVEGFGEVFLAKDLSLVQICLGP